MATDPRDLPKGVPDDRCGPVHWYPREPGPVTKNPTYEKIRAEADAETAKREAEQRAWMEKLAELSATFCRTGKRADWERMIAHQEAPPWKKP